MTHRVEGHCLHCHRFLTLQSRGICKSCWDRPGVKAQYPPRRDCRGSRAVRDFYGGYRLPAAPTRAAPGTPEKLAVLRERALAGVSLAHPRDAQER